MSTEDDASSIEPLVEIVMRTISRELGVEPECLPVEIERVVRGAMRQASRGARRRERRRSTNPGFRPPE